MLDVAQVGPRRAEIAVFEPDLAGLDDDPPSRSAAARRGDATLRASASDPRARRSATCDGKAPARR